ncbi:MAG: prepilin peptidase, partial [Nanoarchaeota archaeon]|nr:prepilin peptidase [Nanoarchaeota archaeon]
MDSLLIYFLPTILLLGIFTSYEDIKEGKIRNKYIVAAFIVGLIIQAILLMFGIIGVNYLLISLLYTLFTVIICFVVWYFRWWSAGDAKLITAFVFLTPLTSYKYVTTLFPPLDLVVNAIIPIAFYSLINLIIKTKKEEKWKALKDTFSPKRLASALLIIFSL